MPPRTDDCVTRRFLLLRRRFCPSSPQLTLVIRPFNLTLTLGSSVACSSTSHHPVSPSVPHAVFLGAMSCQSSCSQ